MAPRQISSTVLLILLCTAVFLPSVAVLMLGPLLVALAHEFQTSVALVGQLASATAITWGITAPLAGPVSDAYGRRRMLLTGLLLMAVGLLGSVLAWHYGSLLAFRLLTGVGAALIPPNSIAALADVFSPTERGKAVGWLLSVAGVGAVVGVPLIACLLEAGSWRLPFAVMGTASLGVWLLFWLWFPRQQQPSQSLAFFSHYREVGAHAMFWYVLIANAFQQMGAFGMFGYLAAYLMQTYQMPAGDTALPLALAGVGVIVGGCCGWVGRRPSLPPGLARRVMLGEGLRPAPTQSRQWTAGGPRLHRAGVAMGHRGAGHGRGRFLTYIERGDADFVAGVGGQVAHHCHRLIRRQQPNGRVRRRIAWGTDAGAGRVPEGGALLSGCVGHRRRGAPT
jgi:MFS family permease